MNPEQREKKRRIVEILAEFHQGNGEDAEIAADAILEGQPREPTNLTGRVYCPHCQEPIILPSPQPEEDRG